MAETKGVTLYAWDDVEKEALSDVIGRSMIWGERIMLAHIHLKKGSVVPTHQHDNEQFSYIMEGSMRFWVGGEPGEEIIVSSGEVIHLPSNVPHGAETLEDTLSLDVFSPPRQDWIDGTDSYFHDTVPDPPEGS